MSLQDKKMQLLHNDDDNNETEVEDIFSRYESSHPQEPVQADDKVEEDDDPIEDAVTNLNKDVELEDPDPKNPPESSPVGDVDTDDDLMDETDEIDDVDESEDAEKQWEKEIAEKDDKSVESSEPEDEDDDKEEAPQPVGEERVSAVPPQNSNVNAVLSAKPQVEKKTLSKNQPSQQRGPAKIDPGKKTILIVDDDIDTLEMYADIFEGADYNVIRAIDGLDALNAISDHTPHVIFTGIVMPRMDGFAMMDALKQNKRTADIPVVINSHLGRAHDKKRAEELGAKDFIVRGFTPPREALERIGALLMRNEYTFRFDHNDPEARKLAKDLGAGNFFVCPRGQEMVIKLSVVDPQELVFSARFSCVDEKKK